MPNATTMRSTIPKATIRETLGFAAGVLLPTLAKGVIIRRPKMVALAERWNLDQRAVRRVQALRDTYGTGPLMLRTTRWYPRAVVLSPAHVQRILDGSPEPFAVATTEKRAALSHLQPNGLILSRDSARAARRRFNEAVLDTPQPVHHLHTRFVPVVEEEAARLLDTARARGDLGWNIFADAWFRIVRRVVFGDIARDDRALTDEIAQLRSDANWAFFKPRRTRLRERFYEHMRLYLDQAEPGSLAAVMAATPITHNSEPLQQIPQWLFAFDPAGMTTFRTLALLATHPKQAEQAREEIARQQEQAQPDFPFLRACVLESLRLWPTTPLLVRQTTEQTDWETGTVQPQTGLITFAPFFHRDDRRLPFANQFAPEVWYENQPPQEWSLVPFSAGPAICPGRNLVLLITSTMLAALLDHERIRLQPPLRLGPHQPLPGTLNNYALHFALGKEPVAAELTTRQPSRMV